MSALAATRSPHPGWALCDRCGGDLPVVGDDNNHPSLPPSRGECPGWTNENVCGAYSAAASRRWAATVARYEAKRRAP